MSTVVYLGNQQVQVVVGTAGKKSASIKNYFTFDAPEGSIINGIIMDIQLFTGFLSDLFKENNFSKKDVILVINSTKFVGRTIEMPVLNDNKALDYIEREYADMGREEDQIYSFIHIANADGKRKKVYAEGIEPDFIKDYVDIFNEIGVKLTAIYSGESSIITFTASTAASLHKTFVLLFAGVSTLTTVLWIDGAFYYYNSSRCFHDPGTAEYADDIARSLSQLTQFMKANQIESPLECIQIAGVNEEDRELYENAIADVGITIPVELYIFRSSGNYLTDKEIQNYLHAIGGLFNGGKCENFLIGYERNEKKKSGAENSETVKTVLLIGSVAVVMLLLLAICLFLRTSKKAKLLKLQEYNGSTDVMMDLAEYERLSNRNNYLASQYNAIADLDDNVRTYPTGDEEVLKIFDACAQGYASVTYESFNAESGYITVSARAANVENINKFIKKLAEQTIFSQVDYTGYKYNVNSKQWDIQVTCTLAESAGRP